MTSNGIQRVNLVQAICLRPRMYTQHGTLAEVYALLANDDAPPPIGSTRDDPSVRATLQWLRMNANDTNDIVNELLACYGTDAAALNAICKYASALPAK